MSISRRAFIKALAVMPIAVSAPSIFSLQDHNLYLGIKTPETVAELTSAISALFSPMKAGDSVIPVVYAWGAKVLDSDDTPFEVWERRLALKSWLTATGHHQAGRTRMFLRSIPALSIERNYHRMDSRISLKFRAAFI